MPIRPELRHHYGAEWQALARDLKAAAAWRCQHGGRGAGEWVFKADADPAQLALFARAAGDPHALKYRVILTVAHLNHRPGDNRRENLRVWCQACHLAHDVQEHVRNAQATRVRREAAAHRAVGQTDLAF